MSSDKRDRAPTVAELQQAAEEFSAWVHSKAPNSVVFVSGGFSVLKLGGPRATKDVDIAMDLSHTVRPGTGVGGTKPRPFDTNALKGLAAQDEKHFIVGLKIFWKLEHVDVQVDFVDANMFWNPPSILQSITALPGSHLQSLSAPTLLVGKIISASERAQSDPKEKAEKQLNDITDVLFLMDYCLKKDLHLGTPQMEHLRAPTSLVEFLGICGKVGVVSSGFIKDWDKLCHASGVDKEWLIGK